MKKSSNTKTTIDKDDPNSFSTLIRDLEKWQKEWQKSPEHKKEVIRQKKMEEFKKNNPLHEIIVTGPCQECVIKVTCNKSFFDGSACKKYKNALRKNLKDNGWYKHGGKQR
jgi:hypothetical protein